MGQAQHFAGGNNIITPFSLPTRPANEKFL